MAMVLTSAATIALPSYSHRVKPSLLSVSFPPSLSSQGLLLPSLALVKRRGGVVAELPSYRIPSYGAPRPYQTPGADFHNGGRPAETIANPAFGDKTRPGFEWNYRSPADYSAPVSYLAPLGYGAPRAYSPAAGGDGGDGGSGGDGGRGGGDGGEGQGKGEGEGEDAGKKVAELSLSQKLTLAYAFLVGVGGIMGFAKTGSSKSLMAGGSSALILYYVFRNLPTKPIMSSSIGLGISGLLLFVMGSRYSESGKVFPAGVVALYSLIMTGGYIHGIMRGH